MEDEEIAESWEEAADSGVRANDISTLHLVIFGLSNGRALRFMRVVFLFKLVLFMASFLAGPSLLVRFAAKACRRVSTRAETDPQCHFFCASTNQ